MIQYFSKFKLNNIIGDKNTIKNESLRSRYRDEKHMLNS